MPHDGPTPRAQRDANRDLSASGCRLGQEQVCNVGARDQQHQADCGKQDQDRQAKIAYIVLVQRIDDEAEPFIRFGIFGSQPPADRINFGICLLRELFRVLSGRRAAGSDRHVHSLVRAPWPTAPTTQSHAEERRNPVASRRRP